MTLYRTIVADPPWDQKAGPQFPKTRKSGKHYERTSMQSRALAYPTMTVGEIAALPVDEFASTDAHLYLWVTNRFIVDGYSIAREWGFKPVVLLTWAKTPRGLGLGGTFCQTTEHVLFARRGNLAALRRVDSTWWNWKRQAVHSQKPDSFIDLVESVSPAPRLEMFARRQRLGWDTWGNEALEHVELSACAARVRPHEGHRHQEADGGAVVMNRHDADSSIDHNTAAYVDDIPETARLDVR